MNGSIAALAASVRDKFGTAHRLCKQTGLPRGTVYQVLSGRYPGNVPRQVERIQDVLEGRAVVPTVLNVDSISGAIAAVACELCERKGRCTRRRAKRCTRVHRAQARAIMAICKEGTS